MKVPYRLLLLFILISINCFSATLPDEPSAYIKEQFSLIEKADLIEKIGLLNKTLAYTEDHSSYWDQLHVLDKIIEYYNDQTSRKVQFLMKALAISEYLKNTEYIKKYTNLIRSAYIQLKDYPNALKYAEYNYSQFGGEISEGSLLSLNNIGIVFFCLRDYNKALEVFRKCKDINLHINSPKITNSYLINSSKVYSEVKKHLEAVELLKEALKINDGYNNRETFIYQELAANYYQLGQIQLAYQYAHAGLDASGELDDVHKLELFKILSDVYLQKNDLKNYSHYINKYFNYRLNEDSLKTARLIELVDIDYINQHNTLKINDLTQNITREKFNNRLLLTGVFSLLIILGLIVYFYYVLKRKRRQIELKNSEIEHLNTTLELKVIERTEELSLANEELIRKNFEITEALFKGQTMERKRVAAELHDNLGSTLSALKWRLEALSPSSLSSKEKQIYDSIKLMMNNAYTDVRNISHNLLPIEFEKEGLVGGLNKIISGLNESGRIHFQLRESGNLKEMDPKMAFELYSISLEIINNILKHSGATAGIIDLSTGNNFITLKIKDNGIGLHKNHLVGRGLVQIKERVKSINGKLEIFNHQGLKFEITIPSLLHFPAV